MSWIYPAIIAGLSLVTAILLLRRHIISKDLSTLYWSLSFIFYFLSYGLTTVFVGQWYQFNATTYFLTHFIRQTFVTLLFIAVYLGVVRILTKRKSLTVTLPIIFFLLQTIMIFYFDYIVKNVQLADQFHIIFFDIPFNMLIAVLFLKYYTVSKKKFALFISIAWFLYTAIVPIFFYTGGNMILFLVSLLPMIIMLVGFLLYYKSPTNQAIFEVTPVIERTDSPPTKYIIGGGSTYLVEEASSAVAFDIFTDSIFHGVRGLCVSRLIPPDVRTKYNIEKSPVLWLTHIHNEMQVVDPGELEQLYSLLDKFIVTAQEQHDTENPAETSSSSSEGPKAKSSDMTKKPKEQEKTPTEKKDSTSEIKSEEKPAKVTPKKPMFATIGGDEEEPADGSKTDTAQKPKKVNDTGLKEEIKKEPKRATSTIAEIGGDEPKNETKEVKNQTIKEVSPDAPVTGNPTKEATIKKPVIAEIGGDESIKETKQEANTQTTKEASKDQPPKETKQKSEKEEPKKTKPQIVSVESHDEKKPVIAVEQHTEKKVENIVDNFKEKAEASKSDQQKAEEKKKANVVKKNSMGFTVIGETEHEAEMTAVPANKSIIVLDGLEYLITNNNFNAVLHVIQLLKDKISQGDSSLIVPVNPETMDEQHISILRQEFEVWK